MKLSNDSTYLYTILSPAPVTRRTLTVATAARGRRRGGANSPPAAAAAAAIAVDCFAQLTLQLKIRARHGHS